MLQKLVEDPMQMGFVVFNTWAKHQDNLKMYGNKGTQLIIKHMIHEPVECKRSIT